MRERYASLDALRGLAAMTVVICHALLCLTWFTGGANPELQPPQAWVSIIDRTPLHAVYAGGEAVIVFFVLSGFVLTLPFLSGPPRFAAWLAYYPKRVMRLYAPVAAAVALALILVLLVPRVTSSLATWWVNAHDVPVGLRNILREVTLLQGSGRYNSVLWSLQWEMYFSLALPFYIWLGRRLRRHWLMDAAGFLALSVAGGTLGNDYLKYLPIFGIGVMLAFGREGIAAWATDGRARWTALAALGAFTVLWGTPRAAGISEWPLLLLAASLAVVAFLVWRPALELANVRCVQWLGARSFSLYLVHEPMVVSAAVLAPPAWREAAVAVGIVVALCLTEVFFRVVEEPSRRAASRLGRSVQGWASRRRPGPEPVVVE
ncbi:acyltransferase [Sinomonas cyclohexanicum]|uniref:Acyltransferase n=1 Tax=Sinomonas cyclohexanicum TaxID=322009 RepID=A0ABM7PYC5_SINCY|nr:acyltransferase [Corynebacterium cyclohexanicum]BCT77054.1 acyltransferase [Corynebacterium cyclohexanicum]